MTYACYCTTPCSAGCLCLCHNPELAPPPRQEEPPSPRRPFLGLFITIFLAISIPDPINAFLAGNYAQSSLLSTILAFLWYISREDMLAGIAWLGGRR